MGLYSGIYEFKGTAVDWLHEIHVQTGGTKIKYIKGYPPGDTNRLLPIYGEEPVLGMRDGHHCRWYGTVNIPSKHSGAVSFEQHHKQTLKVYFGASQWIESTGRRELNPGSVQSMRIGSLVLHPCCVQEFQSLNNLPGLMGKIDFISLLGDLAGLVDAGNGMAQAINSLTQKAGSMGAPPLSSMLNPTVRLKIQERAITKILMHRGTPQETFWNEIQRAWGSNP